MSRWALLKVVFAAFIHTGIATPKNKLIRMIDWYQANGRNPKCRPARTVMETSSNARWFTVNYGFTIGAIISFVAMFASGWE